MYIRVLYLSIFIYHGYFYIMNKIPPGLRQIKNQLKDKNE